MNEAAYQDEQYDRAMGIGYDIDPPAGRMGCVEPDCLHEWETDMVVDFFVTLPIAVPSQPDCPKCHSDGELQTDHEVTTYA